MQIKGERLLFLIQILEDSLKLPLGTDWVFRHKFDSREYFHEEFMRSLISSELIEVKGFDASKIKN